MNNIKKLTSVLLLTACIPGWAMAEVSDSQIAAGKAIAFDRSAGNCLSCHMIPGGELPGNVGPPLIQMKLRFPDRAVLRAQVWDAAVRNPNTVMPPYGRHSILTEAEIDRVIDFILTI
ncbi:sulfur oxidation c-type cytochrome SoxX [Pseudomonadales bacterium]|nr:sulfur oxidation c-type cytochrome SoxX [Pseudomonadales bacterium]